MRRGVLVVLAVGLCLVPAVPAAAAPPTDPNATGKCVSETAGGRPEQPSFSFPFECPPPPAFRR